MLRKIRFLKAVNNTYLDMTIALASLFLLGQTVHGQNSIRVCGVDLRTSMPKDRVLELAAVRCDLKSLRFPAQDVWCVRRTRPMRR